VKAEMKFLWYLVGPNLCALSYTDMDKNSKAEYTFSVVAKLLKVNMQDHRFPLIIGGAAKSSSHLFGFIHSFSILSNDRSKASSKTIPPHSAI